MLVVGNSKSNEVQEKKKKDPGLSSLCGLCVIVEKWLVLVKMADNEWLAPSV